MTLYGATKAAHDRAMASTRETELGIERACLVCGEWWPIDPEFYHRQWCGHLGFQAVCKACRSEIRARKVEPA